tara:strand:+ start:12004 stop:12195 length:192 start_codon:yes stop_codon:yes gene_type:complete
MTKETHLGILRKTWIFPVRVQRAIAIIIEAKKRISISFKLHKIAIEKIKAVIENKVVGSKLRI